MRLTPSLMFTGAAGEALDFYLGLFPDSRLVSIERYGAGDPGREGTVRRAVFELCGARLMCIDSPAVHEFGFTPAISFFVDCDEPAELDRLYAALAAGGQTLMPPDAYGFSRRFTWVQDRFGVSWQIHLP